uniref:hypothetical protein n=1 Tax=Yinghuangia sp. YIM S10712 TaxID=3436930 RepID=UPI003F529870
MAQQTGVFMQKFQAAGADTVVVVGGMGGEFPKAVEKTDYRPRLLFTGASQVATYTGDAAQHNYDSVLANAAALSFHAKWSEPTMQACVTDIEARIPELKGKLTVDRQ